MGNLTLKLLMMIFLMGAQPASADSSIRALWADVNLTLQNSDLNALSSSDKESIKKDLQSVLDTLNGKGQSGDGEDLICTVSTNHSGYDRLNNGRREIGGDINRDDCRQMVKSRQNGIVCGVSLNHSGFYRIYNIQSGDSIGGDANRDACLRMVKTSNKRFTCAVSTNHSGYLSVYNIRTGQRIGGDMNQDDCFRSIDGN